MNAIQSLWTKPEKYSCSYNSLEDMLDSMELSVITIKQLKQFEKIKFYTDTKGFKLTERIHKYYDEIIVCLNDIDWCYDYNWAYAKLYVYNLQTEPFVHIDNDVYIFNKLPQHWIDGKVDFFFQSEELLSYHRFYEYGCFSMKNIITPEMIDVYNLPVKAINAGIFGVHDLSIMPQYFKNATEFVEKNQLLFENGILERRKQFTCCVIFEQLFIIPLLKNKKIEYLLDFYCQPFTKKDTELYKAGEGYTHLLADSKRIPEIALKMKKKLQQVKKIYNLN